MRNARILLLIFLVAAGLVWLFATDGSVADSDKPWLRKARLETASRMSSLSTAPNTLKNWPPTVNEKFPNLQLYDHEGKSFLMESLRGKPVLIELVAMSCAGCQAFSGGNDFGGFGGFPAQANLGSIERYYDDYTGGNQLFSGDVSFVQLVVYNLNLNAPSAEELALWKDHFKLSTHDNAYVVSGGKALANRASFKMIPGFLLLGTDLKVLYDSTGHTPRHNLFTELLPAVPLLLRDGKE